MRKARAAAVLGVSAAMVSGAIFGTASAQTKKELNLCWDAAPGVSTLDADIFADGPSNRERHFDSGECRAYDVRPGQYRVQLENIQQIREAIFFTNPDNVCGDPGPGNDWDVQLVAKVTRFDKRVTTTYLPVNVDLAAITTNVKKNRRTTVAFDVRCVLET